MHWFLLVAVIIAINLIGSCVSGNGGIFGLVGCGEEKENQSANSNVSDNSSESEFARTKRLAEGGDKIAQYKLGKMYGHRDVPGGSEVSPRTYYYEAVKWYTKSAKQEYVDAQYRLGEIYANGTGVPEDDQAAVYWYTKAADQGHLEAQFRVGMKYDRGEGVAQDFKEAVKWFTKAADQGHLDALKSLAFAFQIGRGVPKDLVKAYAFYSVKDTLHGGSDTWSVRLKLTDEQLIEAQSLATKVHTLIMENIRD